MNERELRQSVGRRLWIGFEGTEVDGDLRSVLESGDAGGVTLFSRNIARSGDGEADLAGLASLCADLHAAGETSGAPLLISIDQEGGRVQRVKAPAPIYPPMLQAAQAGAAAVSAMAEQMGRDLRTWGIDIDFAPVLDVHTNAANPIIGDRAFHTEPEKAAELALAFARGLDAVGVISCGKHFPGHGDTDTDSHLALPRLPHDLERLRAVELLPFARAAAARIPMIMTAHVVFEALDPGVPATLSSRVVTDLLRGEIGYKGVIVSDDLDMKAIADHYGVGDAAVRAIAAGCDVLLLCRSREHQEEARDALLREASSSESFRARLAQPLELAAGRMRS